MRFFIFYVLLIISFQSIAEDLVENPSEPSNTEESINTGEGEEEIDDEDKNLKSPSSSVLDPPRADFVQHKTAKIIALNKITAKSVILNIDTNSSKYFGNVEIKVHKCLKNEDPYFVESKILVSVIENKVDEDPVVIFNGWILSSSISLSSLEHPVYEIFAKDCVN